MSDLVDKVCRQWGEVRPELDTSTMAVVGRVMRLSSLVRRLSDEYLEAHDLSRAEFDVLCALRRCGTVTPGQVSREMLVSGASITKRIDRLRRLGLVVRETSERDKRVAHLRLSPAGAELIDELLPHQLDIERSTLTGLTERQRGELAKLLSAMLETVEGQQP